MDVTCGPYDRHEFGDFSEHEERGILVVTHGPRAGRVYAVEKSWRERACTRCGVLDRRPDREVGSEWPAGVR